MIPTPDQATSVAWMVWLLSWVAASIFRARTARRVGLAMESLHWLITITGVVILIWTRRWPDGSGREFLRWPRVDVSALQFWTPSAPIGWGLFLLTLLGFAFCWWARLSLGRLWSGSITLKEGHRLIQTGPYAVVRHPIYSGFILAALCMALLRGTMVNLIGLALVVLGFWLKARLEERFLRVELGSEAYDIYATRTPMLIPRLLP
jgi:protein-S-isoprenylcysteine O-methyltransferase Ste14